MRQLHPEPSPLKRVVPGPSASSASQIEKMAILQTLQRTNWKKQEAAQILGLYRPTLYSKMKKHGIHDPGRSARTAAAASTTPADGVETSRLP